MDREDYESVYESAELRSTAKIERLVSKADNLLQTDPIYYRNNHQSVFKRNPRKADEEDDLKAFFDVNIKKPNLLIDDQEVSERPDELNMLSPVKNEEYDWLNDLIKLPETEENEYEKHRQSSPVPHVLIDKSNISLKQASNFQSQLVDKPEFNKTLEQKMLESLDEVIYDLERQSKINKRHSIQSIDRGSDKQKYDVLEQYFDPFLSDIQVNTQNEQNIDQEMAELRYTDKTEERRKIIRLFESKYASGSVKADPDMQSRAGDGTIEAPRPFQRDKYSLTPVSPSQKRRMEANEQVSHMSLVELNKALKQEAQALQKELFELNEYQKDINDEIFQYQIKNDDLVARLAFMYSSDDNGNQMNDPRSGRQSFNDTLLNERPQTPNSIFFDKKSYNRMFEPQADSLQQSRRQPKPEDLRKAIRNIKPIDAKIELNTLLSPHNVKSKDGKPPNPKPPTVFQYTQQEEGLLFDETVDNQNLIDSLRNPERPSLNYHTFANKNTKTALTFKSKQADERDRFMSNKLADDVGMLDDDIIVSQELDSAVVVKPRVCNDKVDSMVERFETMSRKSEGKKELNAKFMQLKDDLMNKNGATAVLTDKEKELKPLSDGHRVEAQQTKLQG